MSSVEARILAKHDYVIVQTDRDREWITKIGGETLAQRVKVLSNRLRPTFLARPLPVRCSTFGYIGSLDLAPNARTVRWLIREILPRILRSNAQALLSILGTKGPEDVMAEIQSTRQVSYLPSAVSVEDFYGSLNALIVINYKDFGIINRTLEAMASGAVVVGEPGAFNGINGFENRWHGFIVNSPEDVVGALRSVFSDEEMRLSICAKARALVADQFLGMGDHDAFCRLLKKSATHAAQ
jgi:hypothetical protein